MATANTMAAVTTYGIDFVNENDARRGFLTLLKHVTYARRADAHEHLHKIRAADREERHVRFTGDGARQQRLPGARWADHQHAFGNTAAEFLKFFRVTEELDQLLDFVLRFLDAGNIAKCDLVFVPGEHPRLGFAEI